MLLQAQRVVLILTDGTPIAVSEYERAEGRVRYFSSDRGQWEQVPEEIVDWERTEARNAREEAAADARAAEERRERIAERRARTELHGVPLDDGIYYLRDRELVPLEQVFFEVGRSKRRVFLNVIAPVPVMPGKRTYSIKGLASKTVTTDFKPAFYMRLDRFRFSDSASPESSRRKERTGALSSRSTSCRTRRSSSRPTTRSKSSGSSWRPWSTRSGRWTHSNRASTRSWSSRPANRTCEHGISPTGPPVRRRSPSHAACEGHRQH